MNHIKDRLFEEGNCKKMSLDERKVLVQKLL